MTSLAVRIPIPPFEIDGILSLPAGFRGVVLFAHGSGSSRFSPRNRFVAEDLERGQLGTLRLDLLTAEEGQVDEETRMLRFDIDLLAGRLIIATDWLLNQPVTQGTRIGYFGASTGAGVALVAAAERPSAVAAVVSRGGRPDLAGPALSGVRAPTLLIVGGQDEAVLALNRSALAALPIADKRLEVIPGATHLFEEAGALEEVGALARQWFERHFETPSDATHDHAQP